MESLDRILDAFTDPSTGSLHAAVFIVVDSSGKRIYSRASGRTKTDTQDAEPLGFDALYWVASMTKLVTAVSIMQLVERGVLSLDEDVRKRVPELANIQILGGMKQGDPPGSMQPQLRPVLGKITPRSSDLLKEWSKSVGRSAHTFTGSIEGYKHPLLFEPGTSWGYGAGLDWAGRLIENVCNCSLEEYMQKNIWSKLGVTSTTFHPELYPDTLPPKLEMANRISVGQGTKSIKAGPVILGQPLKDDLGGIGLWSTPNDYIKLLTTLLRGGQPLLTKDSLEILFQPQLSDASRAAMPLPLGSRMRTILGIKSVDDIDQADHCLAGTVTLKDIPGRRPCGTVSWSGLPNLHWWIDQKTDITAALFTQLLPPGDAAVTGLLIDLETALYKALREKEHVGPKGKL
ncbi:uncharacterized protein N7496_005363 [Penicillium cataractarum]|uniref:Beta-lactamase-related domain-containing protein n=1 Tax=Penicillium cataractarum TaxID=2100454 RepID=A0A9W9SHU1_9EURO|nr:uncharacterized protein N7496_005363 [Penicillium cataractarum]KAJ5377954.1 hypothetical protein N7496_005363 [Penicillium cataractarum]